MLRFFLAMTSLCLASASSAALEDPPFVFKFDNDLKNVKLENYTQKVTETDLPQEFTTILPDLTNVDSCTYPGTCPSLVDARNCQKCQSGFVNDPEDDRKCKYGNDDENAFLLTSSNDNMKLISLDGKNTTQVMQNDELSYSGGIDYNFRTNTIFWLNNTDQKIYNAPLLNYVDYEQKRITYTNSSSILGIAVDWIYNKIYWVDGYRGEIVVSNFNGSMKKVLVSLDLHWPKDSIVVNPLNGWMYWTVGDMVYDQIERAGLDGSRREVIFSTYYDIGGLVLDLVENRLYWSQRSTFSSIWSSNFDGSERKMIFKATENSQLPSSNLKKIALFGQYMYLQDRSSHAIDKVSKCNGQELERIHDSAPTGWAWDLKMYHSSMQPEGENLCSKRIPQCSHFCFPTPSPGMDSVSVSTTICACPDGMTLSSDQQNCRLELTILMPI